MISLTESAASKLRDLLSVRDDIGIKPSVQGGGCSGFTYKLDFAKEAAASDREIQSKGITIYVDPKSYLYLMGREIDYIDELKQSGFRFINPNAKRTCGCGESFTVAAQD